MTAVFLVNNGKDGSFVLPSRDVLEDVIGDFVKQYDIGYICQQQPAAQSSSKRKRKMVGYDRGVHQNVSGLIGSALCRDLMIGNSNVHSVYREVWLKT